MPGTGNTQLGLPLGSGQLRTRTHDYYRHGTICLFAALSYLEGKLIYRTEQKHTHLEWLRFLKQIQRAVPKALAVHIIADKPQHAQACESAVVAGTALALPHAFHAHVEFVDELGGAVLRELDGRLRACGQFRKRTGTDGCDHVVFDRAQRGSAAIQVESERQGEILEKIHRARQALARA